jgi:hypothetical protein
MAKAIIQMGYDQYVMDAKDALIIHEILAKAERFKRNYRSKDEGGPTYHVWDQCADVETRSIEIMPDNLYRVAKLAGKPDDK